jgi:3-phosphoshikimate 1-carboxyvinyltransferase
MKSVKAIVLKGKIHIPGDKSISHRALMLSSQALGKTTIEGLLEGDDVLHTADALRKMGVIITRDTANRWQVQGVGVGGLSEPSDILDMGNSGTSTRLLMGLVATYPFRTFFTGDESLRSRPMKRVITPLEAVGAHFETRDGGRLPAAITGTANPLPVTYTLPVASAQVKSAVLLAGLNISGITTVIEPEPTRDHTERMLRHFGWQVEVTALPEGGNRISLKGHQTVKREDRHLVVPSDPSSAAFPIVAALIVPDSEITIPNVCINPIRTGLITVLQQMGAAITYQNQRISAGEKVADIYVKHSVLTAIEVPAQLAPSMIDEYPILAVAASFAKGKTTMHGLAELKVKESNRLQSVFDGLTACGVKAEISGDTLTVTGTGIVKGGGVVTTHFDHRIAMSFMVMGMASEDAVEVDDATAVSTSFPNFAELFNAAGARISIIHPVTAHNTTRRNFVIAVDGPAASGKGTLARRLSEFYDIPYLDTGSLYRAVGLKLVYSGKDPYDKRAAIDAARSLDENDLTNPRLRQERIGNAASIISAVPEVRSILLDFQRKFAATGNGAVLDGRDIGTVVCPDADIKFFITASLETRAQRRHRELQGEGIEVIYNSVLDDLRERDERDASRAAAPLIPSDDAILIDTSTLEAEDVFARAKFEIEKRLSSTLLAASI